MFNYNFLQCLALSGQMNVQDIHEEMELSTSISFQIFSGRLIKCQAESLSKSQAKKLSNIFRAKFTLVLICSILKLLLLWVWRAFSSNLQFQQMCHHSELPQVFGLPRKIQTSPDFWLTSQNSSVLMLYLPPIFTAKLLVAPQKSFPQDFGLPPKIKFPNVYACPREMEKTPSPSRHPM